MRSRVVSVVLCAGSLLLASGCGSDDGGGTAQEPAEPSQPTATSGTAATTTTTSSDDALAEWLESWRDDWARTDEVFPALEAAGPGQTNPGPVRDLVAIANGFLDGMAEAGPPPAEFESDAEELRRHATAMREGFTAALECAPMPQGDDLIDTFTLCLEGSNDAMDAFNQFGLTLSGLTGHAGIDGPRVN